MSVSKYIKLDNGYLIGNDGSDIYIGIFYSIILSGYCFFEIREPHKKYIISFNHAIGNVSIIKKISPQLCDLLLKNADKIEMRKDFEFGNDFIFVAKQDFDKYILSHISDVGVCMM